MKIKSQRDFYSGLMFLVVGSLFAWGATSYSMGTSANPGAGYFPLMLGIILAGLGGIVLFKSLTIEAEGGDPIGAIAWRPLLVTVASITTFGFLLPRMGLVFTVPLLIFMVSLAGDDFRWKGVLVAAVVLTVFAWAVFVKGLSLVIPMWPAFLG